MVETLKAAAPWQRLRALAPRRRSSEAAGAGLNFHRDDLRVKRFELRRDSTVIFVVDASGSAALQRLAETKGAVELL
ncbi:MAG: magnesium chelatase ATPase subunit D, partial [Caulobacteraceae bacterium]|nr:magnesium chelatase ATPase subunit D [Caulobacteraceae bacterium]